MPSNPSSPLAAKVQPSRVVGRYSIYDEIGSGGMASVHIGRLCGAVGFSRMVAIKYLHPHFARDSEFISMFLDEARLVSRIQHPNVAAPLDVVLIEESEELFLVMEYIHGQTLARMFKSAASMHVSVPPALGATIMSGALHGLHAAHEAADEFGAPLNIVHRDVSPHNIMVGTDGVPKVLDFGVAKAVSRIQSTQQGQVKGKVAYMAPEQMSRGPVDRRADIFAAGIVLWEALTLQRLFEADNPAEAVSMVLSAPIAPPSSKNPNVSAALDSVALKALCRDARQRFQTAREFAEAIEEAIRISTARRVGEWVVYLGGEDLARNSERLAAIESSVLDKDSSGAHKLKYQQLAQPVRVIRKRPETYSDIDAISTELLPETDLARPANPDATKTAFLLRSGQFIKWLALRSHHGPIIAGVVALVVVLVVLGTVRFQPRQQAKAAENSSADVAAIPPDARGPSLAQEPSDLSASDVAVAPPVQTKKHTRTSPGKAASKGVATPLSTARRETKKRDCNPPYYLDGQGIRRVKPECL
jgi:eukaryotic-like serine/threonine-protein kinase